MRIPFTVDYTLFDKGLAHMRKGTKALGDQIQGSLTTGNLGFLRSAGSAGILAAGVAAVTTGISAATLKAVEFGSILSDQAMEARMDVEDLQVALELAMKAGRKPEELLGGLRALNTRSIQAAEGAKTYTDAIENMGHTVEEFNLLPTERKLEAIGQAYVNATDKNKAYLNVVTMLGEDAGPKLLEVLEDLGTKGFDAVAKKMREGNEILSNESITILDKLADKWEIFKNNVKKAAGEVTASVAKMLGVTAESDQEVKEREEKRKKDIRLFNKRRRRNKGLRNNPVEEEEDEEEEARTRVHKRGRGRANQRRNTARREKEELKEAERIAAKEEANRKEQASKEAARKRIEAAREDARKLKIKFANDSFDSSKLDEGLKISQKFREMPVTSLAAVGGGGVTRTETIMQRQTQLLEMIAENTSQFSSFNSERTA